MVARAGPESNPYQWTSIEFSEELPIIWCHPSNRKLATSGIPIKFQSLEELEELVNTLKGAINNVIKRKKKPGRRRNK